MVILMHIPSSVHCVLHSGPIQSARWIVSEADCKVCYAALRAAALEKSATTTLSVAFNLICSLISGNSARTRNPDLPITASKPVHPHVVVSFGMNGSARKTCLHCSRNATLFFSTPPHTLSCVRLALCPRRTGVKTSTSPCCCFFWNEQLPFTKQIVGQAVPDNNFLFIPILLSMFVHTV